MYQKAMPAGSAGMMAPSYGMEKALNPGTPNGPQKITINSWLIVDHTNFAQAVQNQLADYYANYPLEATQDGQTWPPFTASAFPQFVANYNFDGHTTIHVKYLGEEVASWTPGAQVEREDGTLVPRTYTIVSAAQEFNLPSYTETVSGNELLLDPNDFEVFLTQD